jgi:hypothetical protein
MGQVALLFDKSKFRKTKPGQPPKTVEVDAVTTGPASPAMSTTS